MTDKQKLALAIKTLKEYREITITDGCEHCSAIWQRVYELKNISSAIKRIEAKKARTCKGRAK